MLELIGNWPGRLPLRPIRAAFRGERLSDCIMLYDNAFHIPYSANIVLILTVARINWPPTTAREGEGPF